MGGGIGADCNGEGIACYESQEIYEAVDIFNKMSNQVDHKNG